MSLDSTEQPGNSATKTNTTDAQARDPKDTAEIDAEFTEDPAPKPKGPRVARVADVTPLNAGDVFGGSVKDTANASAARGASKGGEPGKGKGRKPKAAPQPAPDPSAHLETAKGMLQTMDMLFRMKVRSDFEPYLEEASLIELDGKVKLQEAQIEGMAQPLSVGLAENGVEMPWWAQFALAGLGVYGGKMMMLGKLAKRCEEEAAKAPGAAPKAS